MGNKDVAKVARRARKAGWSVDGTRNGHLRFEDPSGHTKVLVGRTVSDHRTQANVEARLRRAGLDLSAPDPERERRREAAREAAARQRLARSLLGLLQGAVGALSVDELAEATASSYEAVYTELRGLLAEHPEMGHDDERYFWDPPWTEFELLAAKRAERISERMSASLFERVSVAPNRSLVLRDENGNLWLAAPLEGVSDIDLRERAEVE